MITFANTHDFEELIRDENIPIICAPQTECIGGYFDNQFNNLEFGRFFDAFGRLMISIPCEYNYFLRNGAQEIIKRESIIFGRRFTNYDGWLALTGWYPIDKFTGLITKDDLLLIKKLINGEKLVNGGCYLRRI